MTVFEQIQELAKIGTSLKDVMLILSLSRIEVTNVLNLNGFNSYKDVLKQEGAVAKKLARETMFSGVFEAPTPLLGDKTMAVKLAELHENIKENEIIQINGCLFDINTVKTLIKREEYNSFKMCYEFLVVLNPSSNYGLSSNNITLKLDTEQERDFVFDEITKKIM